MKRTLLVGSILTVAVMALSAASPVMAAESSKGGPRNGDTEVWGLKSNSYRGELGTGTGVTANLNLSINQNIAMDGLLEDIIHENLAVELGITPEDLAERIADGESLFDIAISLGFDAISFSDLMVQARSDALDEAVDLGLLIQDQADWLASRGFGNPVFGNANDCIVN